MAKGKLPRVTPLDTATNRALMVLLEHPTAASLVGACVWPFRTGAIVSSNGGGDYAAQMLLGRMRKSGMVRTQHGPGSSQWELTGEGKKKAQEIAAAALAGDTCLLKTLAYRTLSEQERPGRGKKGR